MVIETQAIFQTVSREHGFVKQTGYKPYPDKVTYNNTSWIFVVRQIHAQYPQPHLSPRGGYLEIP